MKETIKNILLIFSNVYTGFPKVTDITVGIWTKYLGKYPCEVISEAVDRYVMESRLTPTPSDILNLCYKIQADKGQTTSNNNVQSFDEMDEEAWNKCFERTKHDGKRMC